MKRIKITKYIAFISLINFLSACSSTKIESYGIRQIASTRSCHELVNEIISQKTDLVMVEKTSSLGLDNHPIKLKMLADSVRKQRQKGVNLENVQMQVTPEVKETLSWMKSQISVALEKGEIDFDLQEQKKTYLDFLDRLDKMQSLERIGYLDFVLQGRKFARLVMTKKEYARSISRKSDLQWIQDVLNEKPPSFDLKNFAKEIEWIDQRWFLFPTFKELDIRTMNKAHAEGIGYLGLTMKSVEADGITFNPSEFFEHDLGHTRGFEKDPLRTVEPYSKYPVVNKLSISERRIIFKEFEKWLNQNRFSDQDSNFYQILWFLGFHESGTIIHPKMIEYIYGKNIQDFAEINFDVIGSTLNLLNDPKRFNKELKGKKFTREEIKEAYSRMLDFAQRLN